MKLLLILTLFTLAMRPNNAVISASEMTYTVSSGALNSTPTNQPNNEMNLLKYISIQNTLAA